MSDNAKLFRIVIHDDAKQMLYNHVRFVANISIPAARKLQSSLYEACKALESMPYRCPVYRTYMTSKTYRQLIVGRYLIIFSVDEAESIVYIKYILDSVQDNNI